MSDEEHKPLASEEEGPDSSPPRLARNIFMATIAYVIAVVLAILIFRELFA